MDIKSSTHPLKVKKTSTMGTVELKNNSVSLTQEFKVLISVKWKGKSDANGFNDRNSCSLRFPFVFLFLFYFSFWSASKTSTFHACGSKKILQVEAELACSHSIPSLKPPNARLLRSSLFWIFPAPWRTRPWKIWKRLWHFHSPICPTPASLIFWFSDSPAKRCFPRVSRSTRKMCKKLLIMFPPSLQIWVHFHFLLYFLNSTSQPTFFSVFFLFFFKLWFLGYFVYYFNFFIGSTDVWRPLKSLYLLKRDLELPRNIFLFSDGHVSQEDVVLGLVRENVEHSRVFTFAVGSSPNSHFLQVLSKTGGGYYEVFDRTRKSKWEVGNLTFYFSLSLFPIFLHFFWSRLTFPWFFFFFREKWRGKFQRHSNQL